jgi:hypothetical protein
MSNDSLGSAQSAKDKRDRNRAVIASTVGAIIEWYDFGLYSIAAGLVFPALFFPNRTRWRGPSTLSSSLRSDISLALSAR